MTIHESHTPDNLVCVLYMYSYSVYNIYAFAFNVQRFNIYMLYILHILIFIRLQLIISTWGVQKVSYTCSPRMEVLLN